jgi:hypothetical protein
MYQEGDGKNFRVTCAKIHLTAFQRILTAGIKPRAGGMHLILIHFGCQ